jgi:hypothetical protein
MTDTGHDMEDLTGVDLDRAHEGLYFAAKRYCTITEQSFIQGASGIWPGDSVNAGDSRLDLGHTCLRSAVYRRFRR